MISTSRPDSQPSFTYGSEMRAQNLNVQCGIFSGTIDCRSRSFVSFFLNTPNWHTSINIGANEPSMDAVVVSV